MKTINNKNYTEVVAAESTDGKISNDIITISSWLAGDKVKRLLDSKQMRIMGRFHLGKKWDELAKSPVLFYYHEGSKHAINIHDLDYKYLINGHPATAFELIKRAQRSAEDESIFDTALSAKILRANGATVSDNDNPTKKYEVSS